MGIEYHMRHRHIPNYKCRFLLTCRLRSPNISKCYLDISMYRRNLAILIYMHMHHLRDKLLGNIFFEKWDKLTALNKMGGRQEREKV